jgi:hypothetical protein
MNISQINSTVNKTKVQGNANNNTLYIYNNYNNYNFFDNSTINKLNGSGCGSGSGSKLEHNNAHI